MRPGPLPRALAPAVLLLLAPLLAGCTAPQPGAPPSPPPPPPPGGGEPPAGDAPPAPRNPSLALGRLVAGLEEPVFAGHAGDGSGRLFIVEQAGRILVWRDGALLPEAFLDIRPLVGSGGERGLLGLAFEPGFSQERRFYVHYTDKNGDTVVARYLALPGGAAANPASAEVLLTQEQPFPNHNGGMLAFGPDGMLYMALGDGGSAGDPQGNGQKLDTVLGKLLRLDMGGARGYAIPPDNPLAGGGGKGEIWAYGLRNPWRFSFDRDTGDLYIADVGQNEREEVDFEAAGGKGGVNYGWRAWEGSLRFSAGTEAPGAVFPVAEYGHDGGHCSITGGYVYRGEDVPGLRGVYLYGDYCSGVVWGLWSETGKWVTRELLDTELRISSFGEGEDGELYVVDHGGAVHRVVPPR